MSNEKFNVFSMYDTKYVYYKGKTMLFDDIPDEILDETYVIAICLSVMAHIEDKSIKGYGVGIQQLDNGSLQKVYFIRTDHDVDLHINKDLFDILEEA